MHSLYDSGHLYYRCSNLDKFVYYCCHHHLDVSINLTRYYSLYVKENREK